MAFIEDYRLTSCMGILKYALQKHRGEPDIEIDVHITSAKELESLKAAQVTDNESEDNDGRLSVVLSRIDSAVPKTPKDANDSKQASHRTLLSQNEISAIEPIKSVNDPIRSNSTIGQQPAKSHRSITGDEQDQDTKVSQNLCNN